MFFVNSDTNWAVSLQESLHVVWFDSAGVTITRSRSRGVPRVPCRSQLLSPHHLSPARAPNSPPPTTSRCCKRLGPRGILIVSRREFRILASSVTPFETLTAVSGTVSSSSGQGRSAAFRRNVCREMSIGYVVSVFTASDKSVYKSVLQMLVRGAFTHNITRLKLVAFVFSVRGWRFFISVSFETCLKSLIEIANAYIKFVATISSKIVIETTLCNIF